MIIGNADWQETGRWVNNRAENSHLPFRRRERAMLRFRRAKTLQKFVSIHASIQNHFNQERHLPSRANFKLNRATALAEWHQLLVHSFKLHLQTDAGFYFSDKIFAIILDQIVRLLCNEVDKWQQFGLLTSHSGQDPNLLGGQISPNG